MLWLNFFLSLLQFPLLSLHSSNFPKRLIKKKSITPCKQAPGSLSLDNSPITFGCWAETGCVNRMECGVMIPWITCVKICSGLSLTSHFYLLITQPCCMFWKNNFSLQLQHTIYMQVTLESACFTSSGQSGGLIAWAEEFRSSCLSGVSPSECQSSF